MKGYIIKETLEATPNNKLFAGEVETWYFGIKDTFWKEMTGERAWANERMARLNCYKNRWQAEKQLRKYEQEKEKYWSQRFEIIEVELEK